MKEVIPTEQNKNPASPASSASLGATRTFSVPEHAADTLKKRINTANEQSLARKNQAPHARQTQPMQGRPPVRQVRPAAASAAQTAVPPAQASVQGGQPVRPAQPPMQGGQPVRPAQPPMQGGQPVRPAQAPVQGGQPVQRMPSAPMPNTPMQNTAGRNLPEKRPTPPAPPVRPQMMRTRTSDLLPPDTPDPMEKTGHSSRPEKKKRERHSSGGDEGGNTVVSVIKAVVYIIFVLVISTFLAMCVIFIGNDVYAFVKSDEMVEVEIPEYATLDEVTDILYQNDIIRYPTIFKLYAVAKKVDTDFLAGTYTINGMMNYGLLLDEFKEKPETGTVDITIPEGYTVDEIIDLFVNQYHIGTREGFVDVIQNGEFDYWFIRELEENGISEDRLYRLEGYLFPDTYQFYKSTSEYTVINKMLKRFSQIFTKEYRAQCEVFGYTVDEMITLASLIEKEAGSPSEFFLVSSVFHNRLHAPQQFPKFESDATVVYVVSHENGQRTAITAEDLHRDTPYNTYLYDGFPPGPIANPSASAMLAALSPQKTDFFYFVANKGKTYFSETKAEHDAYIAAFREAQPMQQTTGDQPDAGPSDAGQ